MPSLTALNEWGPSDPPHHATWRPRTFDGTPVVAVEPITYKIAGMRAVTWTDRRSAHYGLSWTPQLLKTEAMRMEVVDLQ